MPVSREQIFEMKEKGLKQSEIGRIVGISAERVRQIINGKSTKKERLFEIEISLTTGDVARLLNVHTNTVRRWSRSGLLKTYRVGPRRDRRFKKEDVEKFRKMD
jgi:excisionase family DNA binding protein